MPAQPSAVADPAEITPGWLTAVLNAAGVDATVAEVATGNDDGSAFTLLLEDLRTSEAGDQLDGCTADEAAVAAVQVAGLHGPTWCNAETAGFEWLIPPVAAIAPHVAPRMPGEVETFIEKRPELSEDARRALRTFAGSYAEWALARTEPWSLVHCDFRLDNLLFAPRGSGRTVTTVDWASLAVAHPVRDVAFLLGSGLDPAERCSAAIFELDALALLGS